MTRLAVSYAGHVSDRVQDLYSGRVEPEGIDLHFIPLSPAEAFRRTSAGEFQAGEMSLSTYIVRKSRGDDSFVAIPVFPSRTFRHNAIYVNRQAGLCAPGDLVGRTVGVPEYQMTAAMWARGMLQHDYAVLPRDIHWVTGGLRDPGRQPLVTVDVPDVDIKFSADTSLDDLLVSGRIDALIAPQMPPAFRNKHPDIARLFPAYRDVETDYFRRTGLFPIMHTVVLRRDFYDAFPWVAVSLFNAFVEAKENCLRNLVVEEPLPVSLPWIHDEVERMQGLMGTDLWPYGIDANKHVIATACEYVHEQGLSARPVHPDELFAPNVVSLGGSRLL